MEYSYNPKMRQCVICNKRLHGRSDKRFCDITCKNYYHAEVRKSLKTVQTETMKVLAKNYIILTGILGKTYTNCTVDKLALERLGFRFDYVTDARYRNGTIHFGIFEISYSLNRKTVRVSVDKNRKKVSPFIFERWNREISETAMSQNARTPRNDT